MTDVPLGTWPVSSWRSRRCRPWGSRSPRASRRRAGRCPASLSGHSSRFARSGWSRSCGLSSTSPSRGGTPRRAVAGCHGWPYRARATVSIIGVGRGRRRDPGPRGHGPGRVPLRREHAVRGVPLHAGAGDRRRARRGPAHPAAGGGRSPGRDGRSPRPAPNAHRLVIRAARGGGGSTIRASSRSSSAAGSSVSPGVAPRTAAPRCCGGRRASGSARRQAGPRWRRPTAPPRRAHVRTPGVAPPRRRPPRRRAPRAGRGRGGTKAARKSWAWQ